MEPKIIVMITTLLLPNGDSGVHVKPMPTSEYCRAEADIEASDPFVAQVECSELDDGVLQLQFRRQEDAPSERTAEAEAAG